MSCSSCLLAWHEFCEYPDYEADKCCCTRETIPAASGKRNWGHTVKGDSGGLLTTLMDENEADLPAAAGIVQDDVTESLHQVLIDLATADKNELPPPKDFSDSEAAGRKRAASAWPIPDGLQCEWNGLKQAGGGVMPIIGCRPEDMRKAKHVHHGPDKNTANNDRSNIHMVCVNCHNRWHTLNDDFYGVRTLGEAYLPLEQYLEGLQPHDGTTKATREEQDRNEAYWTRNRTRKAPLEIQTTH